MPIPGVSGSLDETPVPIQENENVVSVEQSPPSADSLLNTKPEIYNVAHNSTFLNEYSHERISSLLSGYIEGTPIKVDWFHQLTSRADDNSNFSTVSWLSNGITSSYLKIIDMEVKLREGFSFNYNSESASSSVTGVCLTYPGFNPSVGDVFVTPIEPGVYGLFKVNEVPERLTITTKTSHSVPFVLIKILTQEDIVALEERTRKVAYFNKERFLSEETALLTHQEVIDLDHIDKTTKALVRQYEDHFYEETSDSIFRPDGVYDPYMVNFIRKVVGLYINGKYVNQLLLQDKLEYESRTILDKLLTRDNIDDIINTMSQDQVIYDGYHGVINGLINKNRVRIDPDGEESYISDAILSPDVGAYTPFDKLVTLLLEYGVVSYESLKAQCITVRSEASMTQFYQIPILLYMLRLIRESLTKGVSLNYITKEVNPYVEFKFTNEDLESNLVSIDLLGGSFVSLLSNENEPINVPEEDITVVSGITHIDLTSVMEELDIETLDGTWTVVSTNGLLLE